MIHPQEGPEQVSLRSPSLRVSPFSCPGSQQLLLLVKTLWTPHFSGAFAGGQGQRAETESHPRGLQRPSPRNSDRRESNASP
jgi:hypothetical protein